MIPEPEAKSGPTTEATARKSPFLRLLPLVAIGALLIAYFAFGFHRYLSFATLTEHRQDLLAWRAENYALSMITFVGVYAVAVAVSVPGAAWLTIAGGFLFGLIEGAFCAVLGATIGAVGLFLVARYALADFFHAKAGPAARRMEEGFREDALSYLLVLRLIPLFPFWLVNLVPAVLGIPLRTFVLGTVIGIIPGSIVYTGVGNGLGAVFDAGHAPDLGIIFEPEILFPLVGLAVLSLLPIAYKKVRARRRQG